MKFTVDLDNKKITINDRFTRKELSKIFSTLNIDDIEEYTIDTNSDIMNSSETDNNTIMDELNDWGNNGMYHSNSTGRSAENYSYLK